MGNLITDSVFNEIYKNKIKKLPIELQDTFKNIFQLKIENYKKSLAEKNKIYFLEQKVKTSHQVAHDIRSPLAALRMAARIFLLYQRINAF
jgi:hypothetical protein